MEYYVYVYLDPATDIPMYVGKGRNDRANSHIKYGSHNLYFDRNRGV